MPRKPPGAKAKGLGAELRTLRKQAGMTLETAGNASGLSAQSLSRLENGQRNISEDEVARLLGVYRVAGDVYDRVLNKARTLNEPGWWELSTGLTQESAMLASYEEGAGEITSWAPLLAPGLLQTREYARSFMIDDGISPSDIEARLAARLRRQDRLDNPSLKYHALIGEPALIGNDATHRDQLSALVEASERENVTIQVIPNRLIPRQARREAFLILRPPTETIVHVELARSGAFLDQEPFVTPYLRTASRLSEVALSERASRRRIVELRDEMES